MLTPKPTPSQRRALFLVGLGLAIDTYDVFIMGFIIAALSKNTSPHVKASLLGAGFLGMALGASFFGVLADRFGRRRLFRLNLWGFSLFSALCAFTGTAYSFALMRFLAGVFLGAELPLADAYLSEVLPAASRGKLAGYAYSLSFLAVPLSGVVGALLLPIQAPMAGWRLALLAGAIAGLVVGFYLGALPESPKWLKMSQGDGEGLAGNAGSKGFPKRPGRLKEIFLPPYLSRTLMLWVFHLFQGSAYYAFSSLTPMVLRMKGLNLAEGGLLGGLMFLGYPLGSLLSIPILDRIERKWNIVLSTLVLAGIAGLLIHLEDRIAMLGLGFGFTLLANIFSNAYHVYQAELYPTRLRGAGVGVAYALSRFSTGVMPFLLIPLLESLGPPGLYGAIAWMEVVLALDIGLLGPRTSGQDLESLSPE